VWSVEKTGFGRVLGPLLWGETLEAIGLGGHWKDAVAWGWDASNGGSAQLRRAFCNGHFDVRARFLCKSAFLLCPMIRR